MSLKVVFALVFATALCCAQTEAPPPSGIPPNEARVPPGPAPASPPEANQNPSGQSAASQNAPAPAAQPAPESSAATASNQPPSSGKATTGGRRAGAKPDTSHKAYVIGPLDVIQIKVWNNQNLSQMVDVGPDGMFTMSLVGELKADGLTERQLKDLISERLRECCYNDSPDVVVQVLKNNSKRYFVYGGVNHGGEFPLSRDTTVMDALALVGGFKEFADQKKIRILRGTKEFDFNYKDASRGKNLDKNILLENGDQIFVKE